MAMARVVFAALIMAAVFATGGAALAADDAAGKSAEAAKAPELPSWLTGLTFSGDLRLRYEGIWYDGTSEDNQHGRYRLRFGFEKKVTDEVTAGFRMASGSDKYPTSTNQTLTDNFSKKDVWVDLAYIIYKPSQVGNLTVTGGKMKNPFVSTDMIWDGDVNPEGLVANYKVKLADNFTPFVTGAALLNYEDKGANKDDASTVAAQAGFDWAVFEGITWSSSVAFYNYLNYVDSGHWSKSNGNTSAAGVLTAGDFNLLNALQTVKFKIVDMPVSVYADYVKNTGEDAPAPDNGEDTGYAFGLTVGSGKKKGEWAVNYKYAHIEANSVVGAFADSDFGYANSEGHVIGFKYLPADKIETGLSLFMIEPVSGASSEHTTILMADVVVKL